MKYVIVDGETIEVSYVYNEESSMWSAYAYPYQLAGMSTSKEVAYQGLIASLRFFHVVEGVRDS